MIDIQYIKELINLMRESGLNELELHHHNSSIKLAQCSKKIDQSIEDLSLPQMQSATIHAPQVPPSSVSTDLPKHILKSPMVGTFYRAASPQKAPFVGIGQPVKKGDIIGIIEAMKILNHIQSDKDGIVKELLITDGAPVEYEQPLLIID